MTRKISTRTTGVALAATMLAAPAAALGHGSVYSTDAKVAVTPATTPPTFTTQKRYVVANHGFAYVLRETNGRTTKGMINYAAAPGALRNQPGYNVLTDAGADSGAQPHATCSAPALQTDAAIRGWQEADPFYNYVPFQAGAAGLEDTPSHWIEDVKALTTVDLATIAPSGLAAACTGIGGTFTPADETQTTGTAFTAGAVEEAEKPLEAKIATLEGQATSLQGDVAKLQAANAALQGIGRTLKLDVPASAPEASVLASGLTAALTGPTLGVVEVRVQVSEAKAKALKLKSRVLGRAYKTLGADGSGNVTVTMSSTAAAALKKAKGATGITVVATSGDRSVSKSGKLTA